MLHPDPNAPGLRVCRDDLDLLDPWRLPARPSENISLPFARPDVPLDGTAESFTLLTTLLITEDFNLVITETGGVNFIELEGLS